MIPHLQFEVVQFSFLSPLPSAKEQQALHLLKAWLLSLWGLIFPLSPASLSSPSHLTQPPCGHLTLASSAKPSWSVDQFSSSRNSDVVLEASLCFCFYKRKIKEIRMPLVLCYFKWKEGMILATLGWLPQSLAKNPTSPTLH